MEQSSSTFGGVSHVVVTCGDITLECDVENLRVVNEEEWGEVSDGFGYPVSTYKENSEFFLDKARMVENSEGHYYTIRKGVKKAVDHTARIDVDTFTVANLEAARIAAGAPEHAEMVTHVSSHGKDVTFVWQTK